MASLDYMINVKGRPCAVTVPRRNAPPEERKAFYYGFFSVAYMEKPDPLTGRHSGGPLPGVCAVVEYEDGSVHMVSPEDIRFLDSANKFAEYDWGGEE